MALSSPRPPRQSGWWKEVSKFFVMAIRLILAQVLFADSFCATNVHSNSSWSSTTQVMLLSLGAGGVGLNYRPTVHPGKSCNNFQ